MNRMTIRDQAFNKARVLRGKVKGTVGDATDDDSLKAQGETEQAEGHLRQAGEHLKAVLKK
jgi:uncharacterized protein YjbJ (UPF0337 family)